MLRLAPQLKQETIELVSVRDARSAVAVCRARRVDLLVAQHPLGDMAIDELLDGVRGPGSRSSSVYALIITRQVSDESLAALAGARSRFINSSEFDVIISVMAREVLGVARRVDSRLMVEMGLRLTDGEVSRFCQVINLSESGMLLRTADRPELGTTVGLTFSLPEAGQPIVTTARVVRHTGAHEVEGVALYFLGLEGRARQRIRSYVASRQPLAGGAVSW
jgi:hypothetical protein